MSVSTSQIRSFDLAAINFVLAVFEKLCGSDIGRCLFDIKESVGRFRPRKMSTTRLKFMFQITFTLVCVYPLVFVHMQVIEVLSAILCP